MAKRRKTKRQKVISDSRHLVSTERLVTSQGSSSQSQAQHQTYTFEEITETSKVSPQQIVSVFDYNYLLGDIRKISLVTTLIIITELGIFWTSNGF